jgi:hypothetical protein
MYSPDGLWWWNGAAWVPAPRWQPRYESTSWTRKLQLASIGTPGAERVGDRPVVRRKIVEPA